MISLKHNISKQIGMGKYLLFNSDNIIFCETEKKHRNMGIKLNDELMYHLYNPIALLYKNIEAGIVL